MRIYTNLISTIRKCPNRVKNFLKRYKKVIKVKKFKRSVAQDLLGHLFIAQKNRAGGQMVLIGFYSIHVLDSKNTFGIFGPLREKLA